MTIRSIIETRQTEIVTIGGDVTLRDAVAVLAEKRIGAMPVIENNAVAGIFSERDVIHALARDGAAALDRPVRDVMTAPAVTIESAHSVLGALSLMTRRRIRHLPVVDTTSLIGFVSIGDLVKHRIDAIEAEANAMRSYIQGG